MAQKQFKIGLSNTDKQNMAQDVYERLLALTFPEYETTESYDVGDFVVYNDQLYKCIGATSGAWDSTKWQLATLNDLLTDIENAVAFVNDKANVNGNYPTMTVGLADNLNTKIVQNEKEAYLFRTTGGSLEVGNNCKEKGIVGGSLGFNQLYKIQYNNFATYNSTTGVLSFAGSVNSDNFISSYNCAVKQNDKIFIQGYENSNIDGWWTYIYGSGMSNITVVGAKIFSVPAGVSNIQLSARLKANVEVDVSYIPQFINLTAMFGSLIADYIYSLEQAEAGAGVAWFKRYFNKPYYAYTPIGAFINVKTSGKKVVGFNQYNIDDVSTQNTQQSNYNNGVISNKVTDGRTEFMPSYACYDENKNLIYNRSYNTINTTGRKQIVFTTPEETAYLMFKHNGSTQDIRLFDNVRVLPNTAYCISFDVLGYNPSSVGGLSIKDVNLNFHYDGERDGEYEPYESETYANDNIELIGIPKIDAQGNLYYEGNIYRPDGTVEKKFASYTFTGEENITDGDGSTYIQLIINSYATNIKNETDAQAIMSSFEHVNWGGGEGGWTGKTMVFAFLKSGNSLNMRVIGATNISDLTGKTLIYELATPTEDSATPYPENQPCNNWGTEERIDNRDIPIPVGHDTDYPLDLKSKLEILPNLPSDDGVYVCKVASGTGEYVALGAWLSDNGYAKQQDFSSDITDEAGLTYSIKKLVKTGKVVNLSIIAKNETGADLSSGARLFNFSNASGTKMSVGSLYSAKAFQNDNADINFEITQYGQVNIYSTFKNGATVYILVSYIVE